MLLSGTPKQGTTLTLFWVSGKGEPSGSSLLSGGKEKQQRYRHIWVVENQGFVLWMRCGYRGGAELGDGEADEQGGYMCVLISSTVNTTES